MKKSVFRAKYAEAAAKITKQIEAKAIVEPIKKAEKKAPIVKKANK